MQTEMLRRLREYLDNTPREQIDADWQEIKSLGLKGPTVKEFISRMHIVKYARWYLGENKIDLTDIPVQPIEIKQSLCPDNLYPRTWFTHYNYFLLVLIAMCIVGGCSIGYFIYFITSTASGR